MGRFHDQVFPEQDRMDPVHFGFQGKVSDPGGIHRIARGDKAHADVAGNHVADGLGVAGAAGNDGIKILAEKCIHQITDAGTFELQDKWCVFKMFQNLSACQAVMLSRLQGLAVWVADGGGKDHLLFF